MRSNPVFDAQVGKVIFVPADKFRYGAARAKLCFVRTILKNLDSDNRLEACK
jgi:hypothetical protein